MKEYQKRQLVVCVFVFTREALEQLVAQIQTLEERIKPARPELPSVSAASPENSNVPQAETSLEERGETDAGGTEEEGGGEGLPGEKSKRGRASAVIQRNWREHRERVCRKTARNEEMKQKWSLLICASEGHGDAAVSIQRPPGQRVTAEGSAGRPAEQGFSRTNTPHGKNCRHSHYSCSQCSLTLLKSISFSHPSPHFLLTGCRSNKPQHSGRAAGCGRPDAHPVGFPGTPGSLHTWNE